jgi:hypothetical protein
MGRVYLVVEGQGDELAVPNLLNRLTLDLGLPPAVFSVVGRRNAMRKQSDVEAQCEDLRRRGDCVGALLLQDDEDGCPKVDAPRIASYVRAQKLAFPVGVVLFYREYETLFVACMSQLAGRPLRDAYSRELQPLAADATSPPDPQTHRDAKGQLNRFFPPKHPYRETSHQLALTRALDLETLRASGLPCVGSLERALRFVLTAEGPEVYPPAADPTR